MESGAGPSSTQEDKQAAPSTSNGEKAPSKAASIKHSRKIRIKVLEKKLKKLDGYIKRYNEADLSLEEMNSGASAYMREDLYKRKFVDNWEKLCELVGIPSTIEVAEQSDKGPYSSTPYPEINRRVQRLLKLDQFPDFHDIVELIDRCDTKHNLGIPSSQKNTLARLIFKEVGQLLKEKRQRDFVSHFGSHLTDGVQLSEDPALSDETLLSQLKESSRLGQEKMEMVCEQSVRRQEDRDARGEVSSEEDSDKESSDSGEVPDNPADDALVDASDDVEETPSRDSLIDKDSPRESPFSKSSEVEIEANSEHLVEPVTEEPSPNEPPIKKLKLSPLTAESDSIATNTAQPPDQSHDTKEASHDPEAVIICIDSDSDKEDSDIICLD